MSQRLQAMGNPNYTNGFELTLHENSLNLPLTWKTPQYVFVNSMSDLFHESIPEEDILRLFETMNKANWHKFQILTKRSKRLEELSPRIEWSPHIWMGVTVENSNTIDRIEQLNSTGAKTKFVSFEPLLSSVVEADLTGIDWVIVGGESGPHARLIKKVWVDEIYAMCISKNIPFFFKQWGGVNKKKAGRTYRNKTYSQFPNSLKT